MLDSGFYPHPADNPELIETHISFVLLAGDFAYKIKKAVNLGFLDFSSLDARRRYCFDELHLNQRLAPALYLAVLPITGSAQYPALGGDGPVVDYAVKMRRFPQQGLFSAMLQQGQLTSRHVDTLAEKIAAFHGTVAVAVEQDDYGTIEAITTPALENFSQLRSTSIAVPDHALLDSIEAWTRAQLPALRETFLARKRAGFVRECHGDLHMGNVALVDGETTLFDCLEFDAKLRWIDVMNEAAFVVMDLHDRLRPALARRFLNRYLEISGDYEGLRVLRFYVVYRALVRAKIHWLRLNQANIKAPDKQRLLVQYQGYVGLASRQIELPRPALIITHGLSGSGKTTHTQSLLEAIDSVRVRSDVERKRMHGLPALTRSGAGVAEGIYKSDSTVLVYRRLLTLATGIIDAGYSAIVDAAFLKRAQRDLFRQAAAKSESPFLLIDFTADPSVLRERIEKRLAAGADASEANLDVLQMQIETGEPLDPEEMEASIAWDPRNPAALAEILRRLVS
jgi:uncharacterized protein